MTASADLGFIEAAGAGGEGAIISCPCASGNDAPTSSRRTRPSSTTTPGTYGAEAYDATNIFLAAYRRGQADRASIITFLATYDVAGHHQGRSSGMPTGEVRRYVYVSSSSDGEIVGEGLIE